MKKIIVPFLLFLFTALFLTSCRGVEPTPGVTTDATWERIQKNGKIVVGTSMDYPPFEYVDNNFQADGFDIAMVTAIGQQLGLPMDVKNYAFNGLSNALQTGQIDIAVSAITVTPDREQLVLFSNVYLTDSAAAVAPPGSLIVISSPAQLPAYRVGVQKGSAFESYMKTNFIMTGLMPASQLYTFINMDDEVANLVANRIDIALMDEPTADIYIPKNNLKLAGTGVAPQRYAIAMPLDSPVLQRNINSALKTLNNNGTLGKLTKKYLNVDPSTVLPPSCVDDMAFVADVTYPDNNMKSPPVLTPGQVFVKTWRVRNSGTCTWVQGYRLVYTYGNTPAAQMGGQPVPITTPVGAGQTVDLSVTLTAPKSNGTYQGFWQMNNSNKQAFGQTIWVGITVSDPTKPTAAPIPAPVVTSFLVTPGQIQQGQCVQASWVVQGTVDKVVFERNGQDLLPKAPVSGTYTDCPPGSGQVQYGLGAYGPGGKDVKNVYITVSAAPQPTAKPPTAVPPTAVAPQPTAVPPTPPAYLQTYKLTELWGIPVIQGSNVTLLLGADFTLGGYNGCVEYSGQYSMSGTSFNFYNLQEIPGVSNCTPEVQQQSANYMDTLTKVKSYLVDGSGKLHYYDSSGFEILLYNR